MTSPGSDRYRSIRAARSAEKGSVWLIRSRASASSSRSSASRVTRGSITTVPASLWPWPGAAGSKAFGGPRYQPGSYANRRGGPPSTGAAQRSAVASELHRIPKCDPEQGQRLRSLAGGVVVRTVPILRRWEPSHRGDSGRRGGWLRSLPLTTTPSIAWHRRAARGLCAAEPSTAAARISWLRFAGGLDAQRLDPLGVAATAASFGPDPAIEGTPSRSPARPSALLRIT